MTKLIVQSGGLFTTVQDAGRNGHYDIGMPPSGAMDQYSYAAANMLVGNPVGAAALEATYIGPELEFTDDRLVAVTGAAAPVMLNGEPVETWQTMAVGAGDVLKFSMITAGTRFYIAVSGGVDVSEYLGSRSTYTLTGIGGLDGRKLTEGDRLPLGKTSENGSPRPGAAVPEELRPALLPQSEVRVVVGLCAYRLTDAALHSFLKTEWKVTKDADRIGYRLRGGTLDFVEREQPAGAGSDPANVVDLGYPIGSIQVPGGDEPIVLLNDAVTGGGYATIATVVSADRDIFGQAKTGDRVRFVSVDLETALAARSQRRERLERLRATLTP
ncbi:biotin-dependent carboxyltransferase family protein [Saccharopolyspora sp. ASAGF58]|uniref:5-oxoprolinase subunit C family protein n=1 Tax=Saccharopolyspora sp. ASAGF58 TaxID=2719023 RepID=UPI00143FCFF9|nr:biotin-dependent carboxyltransferase family protein [Saccharopolyspora sp. ASAGF58]QIZ37635.1 biotin-dependent carboxyltransferase [Saccharopolyspora sp. ASAGF58]